jgi:CheY-like chemotaxis protein
MTKIALIDDREEARKLVADVINDAIDNLELNKQWSVIEIAPLLDLNEYLDWISEEDVGILIVDERLGEIPDDNGKAVSYKGSELVNLLRKKYKEMPIYGVTSYPEDEPLQEYFSLFDEVIKREDFTARASLYLDRFLRNYKNFLNANEKELSELSEIAKKIALGESSSSERKRAEAIQKNLEIPLTTSSINDRKQWIDEYEKTINEFKKTQQDIENFLEKDK